MKVFLSSVIEGFEAFSAAAKKAVETVDAVPIMSESFGVRPYSSERACLTEIDSSDVYVVMLGNRYGYEQVPGISVTQQEFRHVVKLGRPILILVQGIEMEDKQVAFKREVENYHSGFHRESFVTPEELKEKLIQGLVRLGRTQTACSQEEFISRVGQALVYRGSNYNHHGGPKLSIAFLPQPSREIDIVELEGKLDAIFNTLCQQCAANLREGYKPLAERDMTGLQTGKLVVKYFDDGLVLISTSPTDDSSGISFGNHYVPPSIVSRIALVSFSLFDANGGWCQISLDGMEHRIMQELPRQNTGSFSMPMRSETEHSLQKLLIPCTEAAYGTWVDGAVRRFARVFSSQAG